MRSFVRSREGHITIHEKGDIHGKGEGLVFLQQLNLKRAARLRTDVLSTKFYDDFRNNGRKLDPDTLIYLQDLHGSFKGQPMGVRPSEKHENDPNIPTSGSNTTFMIPNSSFNQFTQAVLRIFEQFERIQGNDSQSVAIVVNPIPGVLDRTPAGLYYYPMSSGVADSFFFYPVEGKSSDEGVARIAFGHGYAAVRDDFPIIPMLTIRNPEIPSKICSGQKFFYAIDMDKSNGLKGVEMEKMEMLNVRHAGPHVNYFGSSGGVDFDKLLSPDDPLGLGYASGLRSIMEQIAARSGNFQIEFTFNVFDGKGVVHVVQYKVMPGIDTTPIEIPIDGKREFVSTDHVQGHGIIKGIRHAIAISPFNYRKENHDDVREKLKGLNQGMKERGERYILVCPGRLGTSNRDWGMSVEFSDISNAAAIVEFGYDISGSHAIEMSREEMTGGHFGSHFLWQILGGASESDKVRRLRMLGSQGTHFITNLITKGIIYLHVDPLNARLDPWFFEPPQGQPENPVYQKTFDQPVTVYAELSGKQKRCVIK